MGLKIFLLLLGILSSNLQVQINPTESIYEELVLTFEDSDRNVLATGQDLIPQSIKVTSSEFGNYYIHGEFKDHDKLTDISHQMLWKELGVYINGKLVANPIVNQVITSGQFSIVGGFSQEEAEELAEMIRSSAE